MYHPSGYSELKWVMEVFLEIVAWINISGFLASCLKNPGTHRLQSGKETLFRNNTVIQ